MSCSTVSDAKSLLDQYHQQMTIVNISAFLNKACEFKEKGQNISSILEKEQIVKSRVFDLISSQEGQNARAIANLFLYSFKLNFLERYPDLDKLFVEKIIDLYMSMNDQEISNCVYVLAKQYKSDIIFILLGHLEANISNYHPKSTFLVLQSVTSVQMTSPTLLKNGLQNLLRKQNERRISALDYTNLLYIVGNFPDIVEEFPNLRVSIEALGKRLLPDMNLIDISTTFHWLVNLEQDIVSDEFYSLFERRILAMIGRAEERAYTTILRGFALRDKGSDKFYEEMKKYAYAFIQHGESLTLITILYSFARNRKGDRNLYSKIVERIESEFERLNISPKDFQFLFYSLVHHKEEMTISSNFKTKLNEYIEQNLNSFTLKNISSLFAMISIIFDDVQEILVKGRSIILATKQISLKEISELILSYTINYKGFVNDIQFFEYMLQQLEVQLIQDFSKITHKKLKESGFFSDLGRILHALTVWRETSPHASQFESRIKLVVKSIEGLLVEYVKMAGRLPIDLEIPRILQDFERSLKIPIEKERPLSFLSKDRTQ
eukprot:TRINITY_DN11107_c0_g2_i1.p1 TRINITY_DN11107_c0_g2~~TRINITY_DN11107_c0_g2_i1.p1  ORF type:complete len:550 (+),score=109.36 TRINITY_DN11107_c0_g2_i1:159-1808(+)